MSERCGDKGEKGGKEGGDYKGAAGRCRAESEQRRTKNEGNRSQWKTMKDG